MAKNAITRASSLLETNSSNDDAKENTSNQVESQSKSPWWLNIAIWLPPLMLFSMRLNTFSGTQNRSFSDIARNVTANLVGIIFVFPFYFTWCAFLAENEQPQFAQKDSMQDEKQKPHEEPLFVRQLHGVACLYRKGLRSLSLESNHLAVVILGIIGIPLMLVAYVTLPLWTLFDSAHKYSEVKSEEGILHVNQQKMSSSSNNSYGILDKNITTTLHGADANKMISGQGHNWTNYPMLNQLVKGKTSNQRMHEQMAVTSLLVHAVDLFKSNNKQSNPFNVIVLPADGNIDRSALAKNTVERIVTQVNLMSQYENLSSGISNNKTVLLLPVLIGIHWLLLAYLVDQQKLVFIHSFYNKNNPFCNGEDGNTSSYYQFYDYICDCVTQQLRLENKIALCAYGKKGNDGYQRGGERCGDWVIWNAYGLLTFLSEKWKIADDIPQSAFHKGLMAYAKLVDINLSQKTKNKKIKQKKKQDEQINKQILVLFKKEPSTGRGGIHHSLLIKHLEILVPWIEGAWKESRYFVWVKNQFVRMLTNCLNDVKENKNIFNTTEGTQNSSKASIFSGVYYEFSLTLARIFCQDLSKKNWSEQEKQLSIESANSDLSKQGIKDFPSLPYFNFCHKGVSELNQTFYTLLQAYSGEAPNSVLRPESILFEEEFHALMNVCQQMNAVLPGHFAKLLDITLGENYWDAKEQFNECQKKKETLQKKIKEDEKTSKNLKKIDKKDEEKNASDNKPKTEVSESNFQTKLSGSQEEGTEVSKQYTDCVTAINLIRDGVLKNVREELKTVLGVLVPPEVESSSLVVVDSSEAESNNESNCVDTINQYYFCRQLQSIVKTLVHGDYKHGQNNQGPLADDVELKALLLNINDVINNAILQNVPEVSAPTLLSKPQGLSNSLACQLKDPKNSLQTKGAGLFSSEGGVQKRSQSDSNLQKTTEEDPEKPTRNRSTSPSLREA